MALPLFVLVVLSSNIDQFLNLKIENAMRDTQGLERIVYFYGFLSLVSSVVFPVILTVIGLYAVSAQGFSLRSFFARNLNQVSIEMLRAWGKTLLWSLAFIVPGIWKYFTYTFVPFMVTSSKEYDLGHRDALDSSAQIVRANFCKVAGVLLIFHFFIPLTLTSLFDSFRLLWKTPFQSLLLNLLDTYLFIFSIQILFLIFKKEVNHDADVQLERH